MSAHEARDFRWAWLAAVVVAAMALMVACSDDETVEPQPDGGNEVGVDADAAPDVAPDAEPDVAPDQAPDVTPDGEGDAAPDAVGDVEPPELRDLRATIAGELGSEVDLTQGDETRVLPEPASATFRIFASDDESAAADLVVRVVDEGGADLSSQTVEFRNGLWNVTLTVEGGLALGVEVEDESGNVTSSPYRLRLPTQQEALVDDWETRFFTANQTLTHRHESTFGEGTWSETELDTNIERTGDWLVDDDGFHLAETTRTDPGEGPSDSDPETVEWEQVSTFYVDDRYFVLGPFAAEGDGADLVDTWSRTLETYEPNEGGTLELVESLTVTLEIDGEGGGSGEEAYDGNWTETWSGQTYEGMSSTPIEASWAGTYRVELNENYTENIGDFLVRVVTEVDGEPTTAEPDRWDLHAVRLGRLLLNPRLRAIE